MAKTSGLYPRGPKEIYWGRFTYLGTEYRESLRTSDRKLAAQRFEVMRQRIVGEVSFGEKEQRTFDQAAARFITEHLPRLKPKSATRYIVSIKNLTPYLRDKKLADIQNAALDAFVTARENEGTKSPTIRRDLACLSSIFSLAEEWEWVKGNPVKGFLKRQGRRGLKESPPRPRYLSIEEEARILAAASPAVAGAIKFAIDTGLRKEEQFSLTWSDVNLDRGEITVRGANSKNSRDRTVPILPRTRAVLLGLERHPKIKTVFWHTDLRGRRAARRFNTMDRGLKAACRRAGVSDVRWHDLRRTCGSRLIQDRGLDMHEVKGWLGHSSVVVTETTYAFLGVRQLHTALGKMTDAERHKQIDEKPKSP